MCIRDRYIYDVTCWILKRPPCCLLVSQSMEPMVLDMGQLVQQWSQKFQEVILFCAVGVCNFPGNSCSKTTEQTRDNYDTFILYGQQLCVRIMRTLQLSGGVWGLSMAEFQCRWFEVFPFPRPAKPKKISIKNYIEMSTKPADSRYRFYKNKDKDLTVSYTFTLSA